MGSTTEKIRTRKDSGLSRSFVSRKESRGLFFQPKLTVGPADDVYEKEADSVADKVMRMSDSEHIQTKISPIHIQPKCAACEEEDHLQRKENEESDSQSEAPSIISDALGSGGNSLDNQTRSFMENRFGYDFSGVKIHSDTVAAKSAQSINALAYTSGKSIVFNEGQYSPDTDTGKKLLAHELTHVVQQTNGVSSSVQRSCSNASFCTPYPTVTEAANAEWWIRNTYMRLEGYPTYGPEVNDLYERFLNRSPGDSLAPVVFNHSGSYVVRAFNSSWDTKNDMEAVIDMVGNRLHMMPGGPLRDHTPTTMSLANFLTPAEMNNRPINYSNPFSVAGHIAGGIGTSDAGPDYRKITYSNVTLERVPLLAGVGYVSVTLIPHYEVFDAVDFCPGDCGSWLEQRVTIPMSRLEASGAAYDQPFKVIFSPEPRSKRFWF